MKQPYPGRIRVKGMKPPIDIDGRPIAWSYFRGFWAHEDGKPVTECPYRAAGGSEWETKHNVAWVRGWNDYHV